MNALSITVLLVLLNGCSGQQCTWCPTTASACQCRYVKTSIALDCQLRTGDSFPVFTDGDLCGPLENVSITMPTQVTIPADAFQILEKKNLISIELISKDKYQPIPAKLFSGFSLSNKLIFSGNMDCVENVFEGLTISDFTWNNYTSPLQGNLDLDTILKPISKLDYFFVQGYLQSTNRIIWPSDPKISYVTLEGIAEVGKDGWDRLAGVKSLYLGGLYPTIDNLTYASLPSLESLTISSLGTANIKSGTFANGNFKSINTVTIALQFGRIERHTFEGLEATRLLFLEGNRIFTIEAGAFTGFNNVISLTLGNNLLTELPAGTFSGGLSNLGFLDLSRNQLTDLKAGAFPAEMSKLEDLNLAHNNITQLEKEVFKNLTGLKTLTLARNFIATVKTTTLDSAPSLLSLILSGNNIATIEANAFSKATKLWTLDLSNNLLKTLQTGAFVGVSTSAENGLDLSISNNVITKIESGTFDPTSKIRSLDLSNNRITELGDTVFGSLPSTLYTLILDENYIPEITTDSFPRNLANVGYLSLMVNSIADLGQNAFPKSTNELLLAANRHLTTLKSNVFGGLNNLSQMNFPSELTTIESNAFGPELSQIDTLELQGLDVGISTFGQNAFNLPNLLYHWMKIGATADVAVDRIIAAKSLDLQQLQLYFTGKNTVLRNPENSLPT